MRLSPNTTTIVEYASVYQKAGPEALIARVPRSVAGAFASAANLPPSRLRMSGRLNGNQWRASKSCDIEPPDFQL